MTRKKMIRETAPAYAAQPMSEVFWLAFQSLPEDEQGAFLLRLLEDPDWYEEVEDLMSIISARDQPSRPFAEFEEELKREGRL